jgi:hypothetical protein
MSASLAEVDEEPSAGASLVDATPMAGRDSLREDLARTIERGGGRWSRALTAVAWIHLGSFLECQALHDPSLQSDPRMVLVWGAELVAVIVTMRAIVGPRWFASSSAVGVVTRFWATFLILSFNLVMLNALTGWESRWYKPAWGTLSTFFFASLAWLFTPRFFIPAVQMYFTALLMVAFKNEENLVYGVSWWVALMGIAGTVRRRERQCQNRRSGFPA